MGNFAGRAEGYTEGEFYSLLSISIPPLSGLKGVVISQKNESSCFNPTFGVLTLIATVWVFVETLNASTENQARILSASKLAVFLCGLHTSSAATGK